MSSKKKTKAPDEAVALNHVRLKTRLYNFILEKRKHRETFSDTIERLLIGAAKSARTQARTR